MLAVSTPISTMTSGARATASSLVVWMLWRLTSANTFVPPAASSMSCRNPMRAARVNAAQRFGVAPEHEQRSRPRPAGDPLSDVCNLRFDAVGERRRSPLRCRCARQAREWWSVMSARPACWYRNIGMLRALDLRPEIVLRSVHDDEIRFQRDDALDVGIDEAADLRARQRLWRIAVEIADADHARARAHREQHLGRRRDDRDDALRARLGLAAG